MNDHLADTVRSTESLLKHQTRQAILDATDQISSNFQSRPVQPGLKRRRFTDSPVNEANCTDSVSGQDSAATHGEAVKRPCLEGDPNKEPSWQPERVEYWVAMDLVTAGRQDSDLGRDQTPIVQFVLALGQFTTKAIKDRLLINVHSDSYIRQTNSAPETQSATTIQSGTIVRQESTDDQNVTCPKNTLVSDPNTDESVASVNSTEPPNHQSSPSKDTFHSNGFVPLSTEAAECVARNSQSNIPSVNANSFEEALDTIEGWLKSHGVAVGENPADCSLVLISDGHKPTRNVLHPEAAYRGVDRDRLGRTPWVAYVDLIGWCKHSSTSPSASNSASITTLTDAIEVFKLSLDSSSGSTASVTKLDQMVSIIQYLITNGVPLCEPQIVQTRYQHRVFSRNISIKDGQVVEVRQVPWSATPSIISGFFSGLNLIPGGVAIRLTDGRRSNTAIVAFESVQHAQLALVRHQHQLCGALLPDTVSETSSQTGADKSNGKDQPTPVPSSAASSKPVMLQVYSATGREFIQCAGCEQQAVVEFLNQLTNGEQVVVRVRGLPYTVTKEQILDFFLAVQAAVLFDCQGIHLVAYPDRRPTGDAFVLFADDKTATRALTRHKDYLGDRYVELFKASPSEMVQVCHNVSQQQTHNSNKSQSNLFDVQTRGRTGVNALSLNPVLPALTPYLPREAQMALALKNLRPACSITPLSSVPISAGVLPTAMFPMCDVHSTLAETPATDPTLDQLAMLNSLGLNQAGLLPFGLNVPRQLSALTNLSSISPSLTALQAKPVIKDLTDPTDPDCPFARPWSEQGVSAVLELSSLPLETSRHDVRLYLGPANFAKVYRMLRKDLTEGQTTSTWLLSLINTTEAIQLIRDLVNRTFSLGGKSDMPNQVRVFPNVPTFALYRVGPDKQLEMVPLDDPNLCIPFNRIHNISGALGQQQQQQQQQQQRPPQTATQHVHKAQHQHLHNAVHLNPPIAVTSFLPRPDGPLQAAMNKLPTNPFVSNGTSAIPTDSVYHQWLQALASQSQLTNLKSSGCQLNPSAALSAASLPGSVAPISNPPAQVLTSSGSSLLPIPSAHLGNLSDFSTLMNSPLTLGPFPADSNSNTCLVMITGAPTDASAEELTSLFQPVGNLLSSPPRFTMFQSQPNGTANFLAVFNSPLEAQAAALYCPSGSLRNNQYAIGTACLVPPTTSIDPSGAMRYNPSNPNLMFGPLTLNNSNVFP